MVGQVTQPQLRRSASDRVLLGVCGGLGTGIGVDPVLVRLAFVLGVVAGGIGPVAYAALAVLLPGPPRGEPRREGRARRQEAMAIVLLIVPACIALDGADLLLPTGVVAPGGLLLGGLALIWRRASSSRLAREGEDAPGWARPAAIEVLRVGGGVVLLGSGAFVLLEQSGDVAAAGSAVITAATVAAGIGLLVAPRLARARSAAALERSERVRVEERERVAARLHDSVLQTLALIQRSDDSRRSQGLARRQERELRAWLYGGEDLDAPATFGAALRHAAEDVEERYGIVVDLVQPSDTGLDEPLTALVGAAREAMTNAGKHAGVEEVSVLARVTGDEASVFVRDRGSGFDRAKVPPDRHGLSESIEARLARAGGRATIVSAPGAGTEIELVLPR